jgi:hypothetical protein
VYATPVHNARSHGISGNASGSDATSQGPGINISYQNIIDAVIGGVIVWTAQVVANNPTVYKFVKKYILKGLGTRQKLTTNAGDGGCMADFGTGLTDYLANCTDRHGIFWEWQSNLTLYNTYTGGVNIATSLNDGTKLYTWSSPKDWYTWTYDDVCDPAGCNVHFYGIDWILYNAQGSGISDNAPGSY